MWHAITLTSSTSNNTVKLVRISANIIINYSLAEQQPKTNFPGLDFDDRDQIIINHRGIALSCTVFFLEIDEGQKISWNGSCLIGVS